MLEFIPYIFPILMNVAVGLVILLLFLEKRKTGLEIISIAFFLNSLPNLVSLLLGGPYFALRLANQGFTAAEIGVFNLYLFLFSSGMYAIFALLVIFGVHSLSQGEYAAHANQST